MVDDPFRAGDDGGRRVQELFLTRALEAVLRLVEIYAAGRNIQTHPDPAHRAEPLGGVVNANPARRIDAPPAASPSASLTISEPSERIARSGSEGSLPGHEPDGRGGPATKRPRGGWTKGNSSAPNEGPVSGSGAAGTSNSTNVRLTRQKSTLFQWLVVPLWVPTGKDSGPTDSGAFRSQFCGRAIVNAVLIAIENRVRLSERIGQFMN